MMAQIWRQRGRFALVFVSVTSLCVFALLVVPKRYTASGTIIVTGPEPVSNSSNSPASIAWQQKIGDPADLESNLLVILSPRLLHIVTENSAAAAAITEECEDHRAELTSIVWTQVRTRLPTSIVAMLPPPHSCIEVASAPDLALNWVEGRYSVASLGRSRLIGVGYTSPSPGIAQTMANTLINSYLDDERAKRLEPREAGLAWLHQELGRLSDTLRRDENTIEAFRKDHGLLQGQYASITSERLSEATKVLAAAEAELARAAAQLSELDHGNGADVPAVLASRAIIDLKHQSAAIASQLASLTQKISPDSPILAPLRHAQDETQRRLAAETGQIRSSISLTYEAAAAQVATMTRELATLKRDAAEASDFETQIASMVRDMEITRTLYVDLSKRASELQTEREVLTADSQLVNLAEMPDRPSFPKPLPFLVGGATLAGILSVAAALHREKTDLGFRTPEAIQAFTNRTVLASVPTADRLLASYRSTPLADLLRRLRQPSVLQESVRRLNAQISLSGIGRKFLITSSHAREGKTFIALAIAQFAASSGKRVLLIEGDLRRPSMAAACNLNNRTLGLTAYLEGKIDTVPVIHLPQPFGFDAILAGESSLASTELLSGPRFETLLTITNDYDLVLIDSPPSDLLMDASILSPKVDGVLYCVRWGQAEPDRLVASLANLQTIGAAIVGIVMTFAPSPTHAPYGNVVYGNKRLMDRT